MYNVFCIQKRLLSVYVLCWATFLCIYIISIIRGFELLTWGTCGDSLMDVFRFGRSIPLSVVQRFACVF